MQCPKCDGEMDTVSEDGRDAIRVDRCNDCHGLYLDQLTLADLGLLQNEMANLDIGDEEMGAEYNEMVYVECPKCDRIMDQRISEGEVRIRFELCVTCHSAFLDAGELRQYLSDECREEFEALLPAH
ncbi:MAG: zf-TFIIB domain-containing protein [Pseudomonadales bacterium]|nr:zf-TFIIB domain-containing protein [Pseudomonadales bacterium]